MSHYFLFWKWHSFTFFTHRMYINSHFTANNSFFLSLPITQKHIFLPPPSDNPTKKQMRTTFTIVKNTEHAATARCGRNAYQTIAKAHHRQNPLARPATKGSLSSMCAQEREDGPSTPKMLIELNMTFQHPPTIEEIRDEVRQCLLKVGR